MLWHKKDWFASDDDDDDDDVRTTEEYSLVSGGNVELLHKSRTEYLSTSIRLVLPCKVFYRMLLAVSF
jgi:hypothetical protein